MKNIFILCFIIGLTFLELSLESPTKAPNSPDGSIDMVRVQSHIDSMAQEVHFMGTAANRRVKAYIEREFSKLGIPTEDYIGYCQHHSWPGFYKVARTENIIATIKGQEKGKALYLCAHYDSVLEGPGAADDIHAVACMLEVARLLKDQSFKNDIVFLITDGEEMGLLGARAYTETQDLNDIGLILNYEARGNAGPSISFEWSDKNSWLVHQVREAGSRPIASSLSYEIYKLLPNSTDYTAFKAKDIPGINHAFIEGFSYYHNPEDTPENINLASVYHTGDNMHRLAKHFADQDLTQVKNKDAAFFNILGGLVIYPASWHKLLFLVICCLYIINFIFAIRQNKFKLLSFLTCSTFLIITLLITGGLGWALSKILYSIYPQYEVFYSGQYYNHMWYLWSIIGIGLMCYNSIFNYLSKSTSDDNLRLGALLILTILSGLALLKIPTGSYILMIPTLTVALCVLAQYLLADRLQVSSTIINCLSGILPIILLLPLLKSFYLAFSIAGLFLPAIFFSVICIVLLIPFTDLITNNKWLKFFGLSVFIGSLVIAHIKSKPTEAHPIPSSAYFLSDIANKTNYWVSNEDIPNVGNNYYFESAQKEVMYVPNRTTVLSVQTDLASVVPAPVIDLTSDSTQYQVYFKLAEECYQTRLYLSPENLKSLSINDYDLTEKFYKNDKWISIDVYGMTQDSLVLAVQKIDPESPVRITVGTRYLKIPETQIVPSAANRVDGYTNIIQKVKI